jgi:hypothetical protein
MLPYPEKQQKTFRDISLQKKKNQVKKNFLK